MIHVIRKIGRIIIFAGDGGRIAHCQPRQGEHAFRPDGNVLKIRLELLVQRREFSFDVAMVDNVSRFVDDAEVHFVRMQFDFTGILFRRTETSSRLGQAVLPSAGKQ